MSAAAQIPHHKLQTFLNRLEKVHRSENGWTARCPAHEDRNPSLWVTAGSKRFFVECKAHQCVEDAILRGVGLAPDDVWYESRQNGHKPKSDAKKQWGPVVERYDYHDPDTGELAYQSQRHNPKDFSQRRPDGKGGWIYNLNGVKRVIYRAPEIRQADPGEPVFWVEGEKDVKRAVREGFIATTSVQGASSFRLSAASARKGLAGRIVVIIPDADDPGDKYAETVKQQLTPTAKRVIILHLPGLKHTKEHGPDLSDWLDEGHSADELRALITDKLKEPPDDGKWRPKIQSATELMAKELPPVRWGVNGLLPEGVNLLAAKAKKGKSTMMLHVACSIAQGKRAMGYFDTVKTEVLYLALEDNERRMQKRLRQMLQGDPVPAGLHFAYEWLPLDMGGQGALDAYLDEHPAIGVVVIDTLEHVRPKRKSATGSYADDYAAVRGLQQCAGRRQLIVVAISHLRKAPADDPFDEINATMGLLASIDNALVMRNNGSIMELHRRGRDFEDDTVLALKGDQKTLLWKVEGKAEEVTRSAARKDIINVLRDDARRKHANKKPLTGMAPKEIALALGKNEATTRRMLQNLLGELHPAITRDDDGRYHAIETEDDSPDDGEDSVHAFTPGEHGVNGAQPASDQASDDGRSQRSQRSRNVHEDSDSGASAADSLDCVNTVNTVNDGKAMNDSDQTAPVFTGNDPVHAVHGNIGEVRIPACPACGGDTYRNPIGQLVCRSCVKLVALAQSAAAGGS